MKRALLIGGLCWMAAATSAAPAVAYEYGSNFGFADVNVAGSPTVPAFPGTKAIWAGTCDLSSADTANGGLGTAPPVRGHCMDMGVAHIAKDASVWPPGGTPSWVLSPVTQAGAHPDATLNFRLRRAPDGNPDGNVKDIVAKLPLGVVGNPEALPKCPAVVAQDVPPDCPAETQVGLATINLFSSDAFRTQGVYGIEPRDTVTAEFVIPSVSKLLNVPATARGRTNSDYGVDTLALLIPTYLPTTGSTVTLWGVPWATEHDRYRVDALEYYTPKEDLPETGVSAAQGAVSYEPSWGPIRPFFTNPTSCTSGVPTLVLDMDSWQDPVSRGGSFVSANAEAPPVTGCGKLAFDPTVTLRPTTKTADSPAGLDVELSTPQNNDPPAAIPGNPDLAHDPADDTGAPAYWKTDAGLATAHLRDTTIKLPVGTSFNPAAANGLRGCTTQQVGLTSLNPTTFNNDPVTCPGESTVGTLQINTPLLPEPLFGSVYVTPQDDNPYPGSLTSVYLVAQDEERGLSIKLSGKVDLDPVTGQIGTTFVDNPQLPFDDFILHLKTGPRAPLNTPSVCGQFKNAADFLPWTFPDSVLFPTFQDPFDIAAMPNGLACVTEPEDRVFGPGFEAGSTSVQAGSSTGFVAEVTRADGHQELAALSFELPPGLTADLSSTPACPDEAIARIAVRTGLQETNAPACPDSSRIGAVDTLAGAGPLPLPTSGRLYLAGPYDPDGAGPERTAPLSVLAVVPAIAGGSPGDPAFDLGNVVVRSAAFLDPRTAEVRVAATSLPYIVGGVPLRVRRVSVHIDRSAFMRNPTNCSELRVGADLGGAADPLDPADDSIAERSARFQVGNCAALGFKPRLAIRFFGPTHHGANQRLRAVLRARPGDANISRAAVTLPRAAFLDQSHLDTICTRVQFAAGSCPGGSVIGHATAHTPLLNEPLTGPVYLRSSDNPLPDMVAALRGPAHTPIEVELVGRIDSKNEGIRTTFDVAPDAPVSKFVLNMKAGSRSLIELSRNICRGKHRATVRLAAHNGRRANFRTVVDNPRCKKQRKPAAEKRQ